MPSSLLFFYFLCLRKSDRRVCAYIQIPIICGTACGALLTRPTPHFACNCRVCASAPEAERLVFLSRNAFVMHLRETGAFGNKKEGLLYVVQSDGSSASHRTRTQLRVALV